MRSGGYLPARRPPRDLGIFASVNSTCWRTMGSYCAGETVTEGGEKVVRGGRGVRQRAARLGQLGAQRLRVRKGGKMRQACEQRRAVHAPRKPADLQVSDGGEKPFP